LGQSPISSDFPHFEKKNSLFLLINDVTKSNPFYFVTFWSFDDLGDRKYFIGGMIHH
jgi:hypothetical protein